MAFRVKQFTFLTQTVQTPMLMVLFADFSFDVFNQEFDQRVRRNRLEKLVSAHIFISACEKISIRGKQFSSPRTVYGHLTILCWQLSAFFLRTGAPIKE